MCLGSVCMDLPLIIWRENDVYLPSFQTVALGILFIVGAGPQLSWQIQETGRWKSKTEQICQTRFLAGFSANFCARSLSSPLPPPFFSTSFKKEEIGKVCFSWFLKERSKNAREQKRRCAPAGRSLSAPWRTKQEGNKDKCECVQGAEKQAGGTCVRNCHSIAMPPQQTLRAGGWPHPSWDCRTLTGPPLPHLLSSQESQESQERIKPFLLLNN